MAKAPAFQFYGKDFLADVELQAASASSRGIWINALCLMWESRTRGEISGHETIMPRRLNCTPEEFALFLSENKSLKFANVTICNGEVTIRNRRMFNEEKSREDNRLRVRKCRRNAASNENVTPPSSSASSSASAKKEKTDTPTTVGVFVKTPPSDGVVDQPDPPKDDCPHGEIVKAYHEILPELAHVRVWDGDNKAQLRARWRESAERRTLAWWREFFQRVKASDFLCGRKAGTGRDPFFANLGWLVKRSNLAKVLNGQFDNRGPRTGSSLGDRNALVAQQAIERRRLANAGQ